MYLCEVAIVSQLCISFPYVLHGLCEDYLTCDIAFIAVMPLSRASPRGRYSRIEGVTSKPFPLHSCKLHALLSAAYILFACLLELCDDCLTCAKIAKICQELKLGKG